LVGNESTAAIHTMIQAADRPAKGIFAGVVGIFSLIAGAVGVLSELKSALNRIWRIKDHSDVSGIRQAKRHISRYGTRRRIAYGSFCIPQISYSP
jgi:uncharacterized BrkB/YihY/UPF0761 family membrane protein